MNAFVAPGTLDITGALAPSSHDHLTVLHGHDTGGAVVVPDAQLLFGGDYKRGGNDLIIAKDDREFVVRDYFKDTNHKDLASIDGARLTSKLVDVLAGHAQYAQAGSPEPPKVIGQVTKLTGTATAIRNGVTITLNVGESVYKGDVVQAGANSTVGLTFIDGTVFAMSANARMVLNEMVYDPNGSSNSSLLSLVQGTFSFVAGETAHHGDMKVDTPVATMGIRGTAPLVEIGFEVASGTTAPPVKFQVLLERGNVHGEYLVLDKNDPTHVLFDVNEVNQVWSVTGAGSVSQSQSTTLSPLALQIIQAVLPDLLPSYVSQQPNPQDITHPFGSTPPDPVPPPPDNTPDQHTFNLNGPITIPVTLPSPHDPNTPTTFDVTVIINTQPTIESVALSVLSNDPVVLTPANIVVSDPNDTNFSFTVSDVTHGTFQHFDGGKWVDTTAFTSDELAAGHVRFMPDGSNEKPTFSIQANDGEAFNNLSTVVNGTATFNATPVITAAHFSIVDGGTTVFSLTDVAVTDPDNSTFTFAVSNLAHGSVQLFDGSKWVDTSTFTSDELSAGHIRFVDDGSGEQPTLSLTASDGLATSQPISVSIDFDHRPEISDDSVTRGTIVVPNSAVGGPLTETATALLTMGHDLVNGMGGASGFGTQALDPGDDNSSGPIDITSVFGPTGLDFFGQHYTSIYINNNGNITFAGPNGSYTPGPINAGANNPIIAPFWADVWTVGAGSTSPGGNSDGANKVYYNLDSINGVLTVTWDDVGYYYNHNSNPDAFQLQLINTGNGDFDIVFRYENINWTTGDASGGVNGLGGSAARAGYSAGDGHSTDYFELSQSGNQAALLNLPSTLGDTGIPGVYVFEVHNGAVETPTLSASGHIDFTDVDLTDRPMVTAQFASFSVKDSNGNDITALLTPDQLAAIAAVEVPLNLTQDGSTNNGSANWTYTVATSALAFLPGGDTLTLTYTATVDDGHGGLATTPVTVAITGADHPPVITEAHFAASSAGPVVLSAADFVVTDPENTSFTFTASNVTHGAFQVFEGGHWANSTTFTTDELTAGHVRFVSDGGAVAPTASLTASDGTDLSHTVAVNIDFNPVFNLTSTAGVSIQVSPFGATSGFTFPGAGNVTTPGTPEDRIALGYHIGDATVVLNAAPMLGQAEFGVISSSFHDDGTASSVTDVLDAGNGVTLTQTVTLGHDANYFTTTVDIFNGGTADISDVRFLRTIDPDQDFTPFAVYGGLQNVINPSGSETLAIVSSIGPSSHTDVALIGLSGDWRGSIFGPISTEDPYAPYAFDHPQNPGGAYENLPITLTDAAGTIAAGEHVEVTYITTSNAPTSGDNALYGTAGNNTINGLGGNDLLIGLGGADTFVFGPNSGKDTIYDFHPTEGDRIDISAIAGVDSSNIDAWIASHTTQVGGNTVVDLDLDPHAGTNTITLLNVSSVLAGDFIVHPHSSV